MAAVEAHASLALRAEPLQLRHFPATPHPRLLAQLADEPFEPGRGPVLRAVVFDGGLLFVAPPSVADVDSLGLLMRDVQSLLAGAAAQLPASRRSDVIVIPDAAPGNAAPISFEGRRFVRRLPEPLIAATDALADRLGTSTADVYLAAFAAVVGRHRRQSDVLVGVPTRQSSAGDSVGPWSPVRRLQLELRPRQSLLDLVVHVRDTRALITETAGGTQQVPPVMFEDADDGLPGTPVISGRTSARTDLALLVLPSGLGWEHTDVFGAEAITTLVAHFEQLLSSGVGAPDEPLPD